MMAPNEPFKVRFELPTLLRENVTDETFLHLCRSIAASPFSVVLLSGGHPGAGQENRFSLAAWSPFATLRTKGSRCLWCSQIGRAHV